LSKRKEIIQEDTGTEGDKKEMGKGKTIKKENTIQPEEEQITAVSHAGIKLSAKTNTVKDKDVERTGWYRKSEEICTRTFGKKGKALCCQRKQMKYTKHG